MPKRKRADFEEPASAAPGERKLRIQTLQLETKIEHGSQLLHRALKTSRGFERQKLGRRQKTAKQKNQNDQIPRLAEEVQALKALNLGTTAERQLLKHLVKTKRIAEHPAFAKLCERKPLPEGSKSSTAEANVIARLFKSNPVKDVLPGIMSGIREVLGIVDGVPSGKAKGPVEKAKPQLKHAEASESESESESADGASHRRHEDVDGDMEMDDADLEQYNARLASSDSESGDEDSDQDDERGILLPKPGRAKYDPAADLSLSPSSSDASSDSELEMKSKPSKSSKQNAATTFLPSLTMGGYWSGSESADEDAAAVAIQAPRKNRMGQQARRQLWEKKYGASANHVKKQAEGRNQSRDSGWDMRKGATSRNDTRGKRGRGRGGFGPGMGSRRPNVERSERPTNRTMGRPRPAQAVDQKPLHPSWEAARKAKEQKTQAAFQGKKVVFD
ncbi:hypothetical protein FQN53_002546 [Emmonsiellopsis sp. PD_33]|nr:hypothetical protein FQN53_002546 [Emmonsiellopsis sp. PD_33]